MFDTVPAPRVSDEVRAVASGSANVLSVAQPLPRAGNIQPVPEDLALLDEAIDRVIQEPGRHTRMSAVESEAGQFLGTVIVSTIDGAHWRLWPNGHPVVRLASGRDLDVIALAHDRVDRRQPGLTDVYADAASDRSR